MGKTAVFVISVLNQIRPNDKGEYEPQSCIVTCHTRELAHQILKDFKRLGEILMTQENTLKILDLAVILEDNPSMIKSKNLKARTHLML